MAKQVLQVLYSLPLVLALGGLVVPTPALAYYDYGGGSGGSTPVPPDTYGDGLADDLDRCPAEAGPIGLDGCPTYLQSVERCITAGVAAATTLEWAGCLLFGGMAGILITGAMTGASIIAVPAAAAAWAPIAALVGGTTASLLCACIIRG